MWIIVERCNFDPDHPSWEEHKVGDGMTLAEVEKYLEAHKGRILYAYFRYPERVARHNSYIFTPEYRESEERLRARIQELGLV